MTNLFNLLLESRVDDLKRKFPNLSPEEINNIIATDPTESKKYLTWITKQLWAKVLGNPEYLSRTDNLVTDLLSKLKTDLENWELLNNKLTPERIKDFYYQALGTEIDQIPQTILSNPKDIFNYDLGELHSLVKYLKTLPSKSETKEFIKKETRKVYEGNLDGKNVLIIEPLSWKSSCYYGATTRWCTASRTGPTQFESHTSSGKSLLYIIFDGDLKYAINFHDDDFTIYNAADKEVPKEEFLEQYPSITSVLKDYFPKSMYDLLVELSNKIKFGEDYLHSIIGRLIAKGDEVLDLGNTESLLKGVVRLEFSDDELIKLFVNDEDDYYVSAIDGYYDRSESDKSEMAEEFESDKSEMAEEFENGYVFGRFKEDDWNDLLEYFKLSDTEGYRIVRKIIENTEINDYTDLVNVFNKAIHRSLREDIIDSYWTSYDYAREKGAQKAIRIDFRKHVRDEFTSICKDNIKFVGENTTYVSLDVSLDDVIRWYQGGDEPLPENSKRKDKSILKTLIKLDMDKMSDVYEYFYSEFDEEEFDAQFDVGYIITNATDQIEADPEIMERAEHLEHEEQKLRDAGIYVGETYSDPSGKYSIKISDSDIEKGGFEVLVKDTIGGKMKFGILSADKIINLLQLQPLTDIIDEVYDLFEGLQNVTKLDTPEKWFRNLLNRLRPEPHPSSPDSTLYKYDNQSYMVYNTKTKILYVDYDLI
jgi:hypothetical protein